MVGSSFKVNRNATVDISAVLKSVQKTGNLLVCEDVCESGGVGKQLSAALLEAGVSCKVYLLNTGDRFVPNGDVTKLRSFCGIDAVHIEEKIMEAWKA